MCVREPGKVCASVEEQHRRTILIHRDRHRQLAAIESPPVHPVPVRIQGEIGRTCAWFYDHFCPDGKRQAVRPEARAEPRRPDLADDSHTRPSPTPVKLR